MVDTRNKSLGAKPPDLRDLARKIEEVASNHFCYGQVHFPIRQLLDHITAVARIEEMNRAAAMDKPDIHRGARVFCKGVHGNGLVIERLGSVCLVSYISKHEQDLRWVSDLEAV